MVWDKNNLQKVDVGRDYGPKTSVRRESHTRMRKVCTQEEVIGTITSDLTWRVNETSKSYIISWNT